jgi:hypothetical protein
MSVEIDPSEQLEFNRSTLTQSLPAVPRFHRIRCRD